MFGGIEMKKFILILGLFLSLNTNVRADDFINKPNADDIKAICGPKISDEYVPDLVLKQQYVTGTACLEKQIKKLAEDVLEEDDYRDFCEYLHQTSSLYLKMVVLLSERSNGMDDLPGTYEQMQVYSQLYNFLYQILEIVINYNQH